MMRGIVDRFEGESAVIECGSKIFLVDRKDLPPRVAEGDLLCKRAQGWIIDASATRQRQQQIENLAKELWEDKDS